MDTISITIGIILMDKTTTCKRMYKEFTRVFNKIRKNDKYIINDFYIRYDEPNIIEFIKSHQCDSIIISGSEERICNKNSPDLPLSVLKMGLPILALCYGYEWIVTKLGGKVATFKDAQKHSYRKFIEFKVPFKLSKKSYAFCHHEYISTLPYSEGWQEIYRNEDEIWIAVHSKKNWLCLQFHPEVSILSGEAFYTAWINWLKDSAILKIHRFKDSKNDL